MKVIIKLFSPIVHYNGVRCCDHHIVKAVCTSIPAHRMDCTRTVWVAGWDIHDYEEELELFLKDLKKRIYETEDIHFTIIDTREKFLPHCPFL